MADLETKLVAVKELKAEYGIGSQDALNYLRTVQAYDKLCDQLKEANFERINLTNRIVSNSLHDIRGILEDLIELESNVTAYKIGKEPIEHYFIPHHTIVDPRIPSFLSPNLATDPSEQFWELDYEGIAKTFLSVKKCKYSERIRRTLKHILESDSKVFILPERQLSYQDVITQEDLLTRSQDGVDEMCDEGMGMTEKETRHQYKNSLEKLQSIKNWIRLGIHDGEDDLVRLLADPERPSEEERTFLYGTLPTFGTPLYERAKRDRTLNQIWNQRRIALNQVIEDSCYPSNCWSNDSVIDRSLTLLKESLHRKLQMIERLSQIIDAPRILHKNALQSVHECQYKIRAIQSNRKWLERVITR